MRNDEMFNPYPQHTFEYTSPKGEQNYQDAVAWKKQYPGEYNYMVTNAIRLYRSHGYVSANYLVNMVRNEHLVSVKNVLAPAFARMIEEDIPELKGCFNKHSANVDGYVK